MDNQASRDRGPLARVDDLPILALNNSVLLPWSVVPINVSRQRSVRLVEDLLGKERALVGVLAQRSPDVEEPTFRDLYEVGTLARVVKVTRLGPSNYSVVLNGLGRFQLDRSIWLWPYLRANVTRVAEPLTRDVEFDALATALREQTRQVLDLMPDLPRETAGILDNVREPGALADLIAANIPQEYASVVDKQQVLQTFEIKPRLLLVLNFIRRQLLDATSKRSPSPPAPPPLDPEATAATLTAMHQALSHPSEDVRRRAALAFGEVGSAEHEATLLRVFSDDRSRHVRLAALSSLEQIGGALAVEALSARPPEDDLVMRWRRNEVVESIKHEVRRPPKSVTIEPKPVVHVIG